MCRKLFLLVLVLGFASTALAAPAWVGTVSRAFGNGDNWSLGAVPGTADGPSIGWANTDAGLYDNVTRFTPLISGSDSFLMPKLNVTWPADSSGHLEITGGSLTFAAGDGFYVGNSSRADMAEIDMSGGVVTVGNTLRVGRRAAARFVQTGGTLDVEKYKIGLRTQDTSFNHKTDMRHLGGLVTLDMVNFGPRSSTWLGNAVMMIDSGAGRMDATDIDIEVDRVIANGQLKAYGVTSGTTIGSVTYEIVKSWDMGIVLYLEAVPEPATIALLGLGGLALLRRKR